MADCCSDKGCAIEALRTRQSATLRVVLAINAMMFVVEFTSGLMARSFAAAHDIERMNDPKVLEMRGRVELLGDVQELRSLLRA